MRHALIRLLFRALGAVAFDVRGHSTRILSDATYTKPELDVLKALWKWEVLDGPQWVAPRPHGRGHHLEADKPWEHEG